MFDQYEEWNISFAGCGFRSIYYVGALSCILERVPQLVHRASKFGGASSGCLVAAALAVGIPVDQLCFSILNLAREARKHTLGVFHPTFRMLEMVRRSLLEMLPEDAHLRATGKLCVSLTRLADGGNVLVSKFDTREELIQVLICSCFFPVYCGFIPPSYHGVHYVDGALSNNMPMFEHRNTITMAPFSGESDICPREGTFNFFEASYSNVSIQVNTGNVYRVCTSFLPPSLETLAEICHNGYMDALRFLKERDLLSEKYSIVSVASSCWEPGEEQAAGEERLRRKLQCNGRKPQIWLNHKVNNNLPSNIKKVLCEACRYNHHNGSQWTHSLTDFLPIRVICYTLTLLLLPIQLSLLLAKRFVSKICQEELKLANNPDWVTVVLSGGMIRNTFYVRAYDDSGIQTIEKKCTFWLVFQPDSFGTTCKPFMEIALVFGQMWSIGSDNLKSGNTYPDLDLADLKD